MDVLEVASDLLRETRVGGYVQMRGGKLVHVQGYDRARETRTHGYRPTLRQASVLRDIFDRNKHAHIRSISTAGNINVSVHADDTGRVRDLEGPHIQRSWNGPKVIDKVHITRLGEVRIGHDQDVAKADDPQPWDPKWGTVERKGPLNEPPLPTPGPAPAAAKPATRKHRAKPVKIPGAPIKDLANPATKAQRDATKKREQQRREKNRRARERRARQRSEKIAADLLAKKQPPAPRPPRAAPVAKGLSSASAPRIAALRPGDEVQVNQRQATYIAQLDGGLHHVYIPSTNQHKKVRGASITHYRRHDDAGRRVRLANANIGDGTRVEHKRVGHELGPPTGKVITGHRLSKQLDHLHDDEAMLADYLAWAAANPPKVEEYTPTRGPAPPGSGFQEKTVKDAPRVGPMGPKGSVYHLVPVYEWRPKQRPGKIRWAREQQLERIEALGAENIAKLDEPDLIDLANIADEVGMKDLAKLADGLAAAYRSADDVALTPVEAVARAHRMQAREGVSAADDGNSAALLEVELTGENGMVAFYPSPEEAAKWAVPGGETPDELHVTLAFLGKDFLPKSGQEREDALVRLKAAIAGWAATCGVMSGTIAGHGLFTAGEKPVTYLSMDLPALPHQRERLVDALEKTGFPAKSDHGFTPHMTLAYDDVTGVTMPSGGDVKFGDVVLVIGDERSSFPLTGTNPTDLVSEALALVADRGAGRGFRLTESTSRERWAAWEAEHGVHAIAKQRARAQAEPLPPERPDTPQQAAILRQSKSAQHARAKFPYGTRVEGAPGRQGTVIRHVPQSNGQGGHLSVKWDVGGVGRVSPIAVKVVAPRVVGPTAGEEPLPGGDWFVGAACAHLALALTAQHPNLKIAVDLHDAGEGGTGLTHAIAYDPATGEGYDGYGVHADYHDAFRHFDTPSVAVEDIDPRDLEDKQDIRPGDEDLVDAEKWAQATFSAPLREDAAFEQLHPRAAGGEFGKKDKTAKDSSAKQKPKPKSSLERAMARIHDRGVNPGEERWMGGEALKRLREIFGPDAIDVQDEGNPDVGNVVAYSLLMPTRMLAALHAAGVSIHVAAKPLADFGVTFTVDDGRSTAPAVYMPDSKGVYIDARGHQDSINHELAHGFDYASGYPSRSPQFARIWKNRLSADPYYNASTHGGDRERAQEEYFAEGLAQYVQGSYEPNLTPYFNRMMAKYKDAPEPGPPAPPEADDGAYRLEVRRDLRQILLDRAMPKFGIGEVSIRLGRTLPSVGDVSSGGKGGGYAFSVRFRGAMGSYRATGSMRKTGVQWPVSARWSVVFGHLHEEMEG